MRNEVQSRNYQSVIAELRAVYVRQFAARAHMLLTRGRAYLEGRALGYTDPEIANMMKCSSSWVRELAKLAETYGDATVEDFRHAAEAVARVGPLGWDMSESEARLLRAISPGSACAQCVLDQRRLRQSTAPASRQELLLAMQTLLNSRGLRHHAGELAKLFADPDLQTNKVAEIVARTLWGQMSPKAADRVVAEVQKLVNGIEAKRRGRAKPAAMPNEPISGVSPSGCRRAARRGRIFSARSCWTSCPSRPDRSRRGW